MTPQTALRDIAKALNRPVVDLMRLQKRFGLPACENDSPAYQEFLRKIVHLRTHGVSEDRLVELWKTEKHLLELLHFKGDGSPTWFLNECTHTDHLDRRLLLTHHDMGKGFSAKSVQPELDFDPSFGRLFSPQEIGDDALKGLRQYFKQASKIRALVEAEAPQLRAALRRIPRLRKQAAGPPSLSPLTSDI